MAWPCFPVLDVDISTILQGRAICHDNHDHESLSGRKLTLDNNMTVFAESRALHRESVRGASTRLEDSIGHKSVSRTIEGETT